MIFVFSVLARNGNSELLAIRNSPKQPGNSFGKLSEICAVAVKDFVYRNELD